MEWKPIEEERIWDDINCAWKRMSSEQRNLWEIIKIIPEKWKQEPWENEGGGFWVVAIIGKTVVWFNDIEDGYNKVNLFRIQKNRRILV
jgi:hypothetical protein